MGAKASGQRSTVAVAQVVRTLPILMPLRSVRNFSPVASPSALLSPLASPNVWRRARSTLRFAVGRPGVHRAAPPPTAALVARFGGRPRPRAPSSLRPPSRTAFNGSSEVYGGLQFCNDREPKTQHPKPKHSTFSPGKFPAVRTTSRSAAGCVLRGG